MSSSSEFAFELATSAIRFGAGATRECGADLSELGARHVLVFTDPALRKLAPVATVLESLDSEGLATTLFDRVRVEPSSDSIQEAIEFAQATPYDAIVAVGGGSTIDTAKIANLFTCWPADFLDYVNQPIGKGKPVPGPVKPLIAIPTTAGTGSETTGTAIFDFPRLPARVGRRDSQALTPRPRRAVPEPSGIAIRCRARIPRAEAEGSLAHVRDRTGIRAP